MHFFPSQVWSFFSHQSLRIIAYFPYSKAVTYFKLLSLCIPNMSSFHEQWKHLVFCLLSHRDSSGRTGPGPEGRLEAECRFGNHHHLCLLLLLQVHELHSSQDSLFSLMGVVCTELRYNNGNEPWGEHIFFLENHNTKYSYNDMTHQLLSELIWKARLLVNVKAGIVLESLPFSCYFTEVCNGLVNIHHTLGERPCLTWVDALFWHGWIYGEG